MLAILLLFILIAILVYAIDLAILNSHSGKCLRGLPGPKTLPILGNCFDFLSDEVKLFYQVRHYSNKFKHIGVYRMKVMHLWFVNILNPEDIELVLSNPKQSRKGFSYGFLRPWLKEGLLIHHGPKWHMRRKLLATAFHFNILKDYCNTFVKHSDRLVEKLKPLAENSEVDVFSFVVPCALHAVCETVMGTDLDSFSDDDKMSYENAIFDITKCFVHRVIRFWLHSKFIFNSTLVGKKQKEVIRTLHDFTLRVIEKRRRERSKLNRELQSDEVESKKKLALLDLLLDFEEKELIDESGIREEVDTFMFAGHDTTAAGITFCLMLLANNPDCQERAVEEIEHVFEKCGQNPKIGDFNDMTYLERCIKESLRLYPSVPLIVRESDVDLQLTKCFIPAGTTLQLHIMDIHRDDRIYPDPFRFDPDRFLPENCLKRHPYAYIPFSSGHRNCIGQKFALLEEKVIISSILRNFILKPITRPNDILFVASIVLQPRDAIKIKILPRHKHG